MGLCDTFSTSAKLRQTLQMQKAACVHTSCSIPETCVLLLQFPLSDYQTPDEVDTRKARTLKEFANFLKIKSDAKRPQHGKKGVAARTRRSGAVIYEARITHIPIGVRPSHTSMSATLPVHARFWLVCGRCCARPSLLPQVLVPMSKRVWHDLNLALLLLCRRVLHHQITASLL